MSSKVSRGHTIRPRLKELERKMTNVYPEKLITVSSGSAASSLGQLSLLQAWSCGLSNVLTRHPVFISAPNSHGGVSISPGLLTSVMKPQNQIQPHGLCGHCTTVDKRIGRDLGKSKV